MQAAESTERILASPLAKRLARLAGVDLKNLAGTGPHGRIVKRDIEAAIAAGDTSAPKPARGEIAVTRTGGAAPHRAIR